MYSNIKFRNGDDETLAIKFLCQYIVYKRQIRKVDFGSLYDIDVDTILAVHFADAAAQGDAGCIEIACLSDNKITVYYGNYVYDKFNMASVREKLPMLMNLRATYNNVPYPFGGSVDIPEGWSYMYMGAMNHLFCRDFIADKTRGFVNTIIEKKNWHGVLFDAIAWYCGAECYDLYKWIKEE